MLINFSTKKRLAQKSRMYITLCRTSVDLSCTMTKRKYKFLLPLRKDTQTCLMDFKLINNWKWKEMWSTTPMSNNKTKVFLPPVLLETQLKEKWYFITELDWCTFDVELELDCWDCWIKVKMPWNFSCVKSLN